MANYVTYDRPYDSEVEYLESSGTQRIDSGVYGNENTNVSIKFQIVTFSSNAQGVLGAREQYQKRGFGFTWNSNSNNTLFFQLFNGENSHYQLSTTALEVRNDKGNLYVNNELVFTHSSSPSFTTPSSINLFMMRDNIGYYSKSRIYYCQLRDNGVLVRDFIPVRIGTIGYMYDKVSGKLFGNQGTGSFILGPDVANPVPNIRRVFRFGNKRFIMPMPYDSKVEYLESTGTQWIDTGIYGSNNSKLELDEQILELGASKAVFGCYATNNNLYIYQAGGNNSGKWQLGFGYNANVGTTDTNRHSFVFDNFDIKIDGTIIFSHTPKNFATPQTLLMFNMFNGAGEIYSSTRMRVFSCKLYNSNTLVRDFIPVRKNGIGYMYDRVSGRLFGNSGTGQFILGNDIND